MGISDDDLQALFKIAIKLNRLEHRAEGKRLFGAIAALLQEEFPEDYTIGLSLFGDAKPPAAEPAADEPDPAALPGEEEVGDETGSPAGPEIKPFKPPRASYEIEELASDFDIHPVRPDDEDLEGWTHYNMGVTYLRMGMPEEALDELGKAVEAGAGPGKRAEEILEAIREDAKE